MKEKIDWSQIEGVSIDNDIYGGRPTLKGTRFPIAQILAELCCGYTIKEIADDAGLKEETILEFFHSLIKEAEL